MGRVQVAKFVTSHRTQSWLKLHIDEHGGVVAGPSNTKKCDLCDRRTTRPTSKVAPADSHAGSQTGAKNAGKL